MGQHRVVDPGAASGDLCRRLSGERSDQAGRRCGVADPHVAGGHGVVPRVDEVFRDLDADTDGLERLLAGHGWSDGEVGRARPDLSHPHDLVVLEFRGDPDVDDDHVAAGLAREHVDGGSAGTEVLDHGRGDLLWPRSHAAGDHAVVAGEDRDHHLVGVRRRAAAMDARQDDRDLLEDAQGTGGLGEARLSSPGRLHRRGVERPDRVDGGGQQVRGGRHRVIVSKQEPPRANGWSETTLRTRFGE